MSIVAPHPRRISVALRIDSTADPHPRRCVLCCCVSSSSPRRLCILFAFPSHRHSNASPLRLPSATLCAAASAPLQHRLWIGNLADQMDKLAVEDQFMKFGKVQSVWIAKNPPGFGFIEFENERDAGEAVKELDGKEFFGQKMRVEFAKSRGPPARGSGPRGGGGEPRDYGRPRDDRYDDRGYGRDDRRDDRDDRRRDDREPRMGGAGAPPNPYAAYAAYYGAAGYPAPYGMPYGASPYGMPGAGGMGYDARGGAPMGGAGYPPSDRYGDRGGYGGGDRGRDAPRRGMGPPAGREHICFNCFDGATPITMADHTSRAIKDVKVGDTVLAYSRKASGQLVPRQVTCVSNNGQRSCVELKFLDGRVVVCTPDHRFMRDDGAWCEAKDLPLGSSVRVVKSGTSQLVDLPLCGRRVVEARDVYDLTVPVTTAVGSAAYHALQEAEASFVANGIVVHNCNETGHWAKDCPRPKNSGECYSCGQRGHSQRDCPQGRGGNGSSSMPSSSSGAPASSPSPSAPRGRSRSPDRQQQPRGSSRSRSRSRSRSPGRSGADRSRRSRSRSPK